jgi:hypothetical protein
MPTNLLLYCSLSANNNLQVKDYAKRESMHAFGKPDFVANQVAESHYYRGIRGRLSIAFFLCNRWAFMCRYDEIVTTLRILSKCAQHSASLWSAVLGSLVFCREAVKTIRHRVSQLNS